MTIYLMPDSVESSLFPFASGVRQYQKAESRLKHDRGTGWHGSRAAETTT